jgi:hypothetical protein
MMTKPLKLDAFVKLRNLLGVCQQTIVNWLLVTINLREDVKIVFFFYQLE